jgi:hypothetical protein
VAQSNHRPNGGKAQERCDGEGVLQLMGYYSSSQSRFPHSMYRTPLDYGLFALFIAKIKKHIYRRLT